MTKIEKKSSCILATGLLILAILVLAQSAEVNPNTMQNKIQDRTKPSIVLETVVSVQTKFLPQNLSGISQEKLLENSQLKSILQGYSTDIQNHIANQLIQAKTGDIITIEKTTENNTSIEFRANSSDTKPNHISDTPDPRDSLDSFEELERVLEDQESVHITQITEKEIIERIFRFEDESKSEYGNGFKNERNGEPAATATIAPHTYSNVEESCNNDVNPSTLSDYTAMRKNNSAPQELHSESFSPSKYVSRQSPLSIIYETSERDDSDELEDDYYEKVKEYIDRVVKLKSRTLPLEVVKDLLDEIICNAIRNNSPDDPTTYADVSKHVYEEIDIPRDTAGTSAVQKSYSTGTMPDKCGLVKLDTILSEGQGPGFHTCINPMYQSCDLPYDTPAQPPRPIHQSIESLDTPPTTPPLNFGLSNSPSNASSSSSSSTSSSTSPKPSSGFKNFLHGIGSMYKSIGTQQTTKDTASYQIQQNKKVLTQVEKKETDSQILKRSTIHTKIEEKKTPKNTTPSFTPLSAH